MKRKSSKNKSNPLKKAGLRHPDSFPKSAQWKLEGDAEFLKTLPEHLQVWYAAFLEAEFGDNPGVFKYDQKRSREVWAASNANRRDVLQQTPKARDRLQLSALDRRGAIRPAEKLEFPSALQLRKTVHLDVCQKGNGNGQEDTMAQLLDRKLGIEADAKVIPLKRTKTKKRRSA